MLEASLLRSAPVRGLKDKKLQRFSRRVEAV